MRKQQLQKLFSVAIEQNLSIKFYSILLNQLNKMIAEKLKMQLKRGIISKIEYMDRIIDCIAYECQ